jgi:hypothetical protein
MIIVNKTCHTVPMIFVANLCLAELLFGCDMFAMALFTFQNDLKQIKYEYSFCILLGYMSYVGCAVQNYSFLIQAVHRYITIISPTRLLYKSKRTEIALIGITWIFGIMHPLPFLIAGEIKYIYDDQVCQMPLRFSLLTIYNLFNVYLIPITIMILIYIKLIRYVREMSKHIKPVNTLTRSKRHLKMIRRIIIFITIVVTLNLPYSIFIFISFFTHSFKYHFRIAFIFIDISLPFVIITLFNYANPLKTSVMKTLNIRTNQKIPAVV